MKGSMARKGEKGFTILELLVVIGVIGVLIAVIMVSLSEARKKGRDTRRIRDVQEIHSAVELYIAQNGYPPDLGDPSCRIPEGAGSVENCFAIDISGMWTTLQTQLAPHISSLAHDPCRAGCPANGPNDYYYGYTAPGALSVLNTFTGEPYGVTPTSYKLYVSRLEGRQVVYGFGNEFDSF